MEKLLKIFNVYKNAIFVLLACIVITLTGAVFSKGQYYNYNYERQIIKDCEMGWYDTTDSNCANFKEKQRKIDDEEINADKIKIPEKSPYDYVILISSILQVVFITIASFILGGQYKSEKIGKLWKAIPGFLTIILVCALSNGILILVNGVFSSNDLLRLMFEIIISLIMFVLGKKL